MSRNISNIPNLTPATTINADKNNNFPPEIILPTYDNMLLIENNISQTFNEHIKSSIITVTFNDNEYILNAIKSDITLTTTHYADLLTDPSTLNYKPPIDWINYKPYLQPVRDQETYGTSVPFAIASIIEFHFNIQKISNDYLSPAFIYVNRPTITNIKSTSEPMSILDGLNIIYNNGIVSENTWPYTEENLTTKLSNKAINEGLSYIKFKKLSVIKSINELKSAITNHGPCVITIKIYSSDVGDINPNNIIWKSTPSYDTLRGSHAVSVVGYDSVNFTIRNSWGTSFGVNGYIDIPFSEWDCVIDCMTIMPDIEIPLKTGEVQSNYKKSENLPWWYYLILVLAILGSISMLYQIYKIISSRNNNTKRAEESEEAEEREEREERENNEEEENRFGGKGIYPEIK